LLLRRSTIAETDLLNSRLSGPRSRDPRIDQGVESTVDLHRHRATSELDDLNLDNGHDAEPV
jgi:hypothetical protein